MAADARPFAEPGARWFVWGVWLALLVADFWLVTRYGPTIPIGDDYALVPVIAGKERVTLGTLWAQHNEHRLPLPRLLLLTADRLSGHDARAGMFLSVGLLGLGAAALILGSGAARGFASIKDATYPLVLLHFGHQNNLLWSWQVQFAASTALAAVACALIAARGDRPGRREDLALGLVLALLPLCGANGVALVPAAAAWLIGIAVVRWRIDRRGAWASLCAALPGLLLTTLYFVGYARPKEIDAAPGLAAIGRTALQFLALAGGPAGKESWPIAGGLVSILAVVAAGLLVLTARRRRDDRTRALGLLAMFAGLGLLTLGLASGRAGSGERAGLEDRYITLISLVPCVAALVAAFDPRSAVRGMIGTLLFAGSCVLLWPNQSIGLDEARARSARSEAVVSDLAAGVPMSRLIRRHTPWVDPSQDVLARCWPMLKEASIGPLAMLTLDPPLRATPFTAGPAALSLATWDASTHTLTSRGVDPWAVFALPARTFVSGIRLRYSHQNGQGAPARFKLGWRRADEQGFPADQEHSRWKLPTGDNRTTTIWIGEAIDQIRIQPDNCPATFRVDSIELFVP